MNKPHKYAEVIKAWADGKEVEYRDHLTPEWTVAEMPIWTTGAEWRIKPEPPAKVYPETRMSTKELWQTWSNAAHSSAGNLAIANFALRHAIDSGQLVEPAKIERIEPDAFSPLMEAAKEQRAARDMAIAEAVAAATYSAIYSGGAFYGFQTLRLDLPAIIATVKD